MAKQPEAKSQPLSEQLREIINSAGAAGMSRYRLAKESEVDAGQLCRFVKGDGNLSMESLDRIGTVLGLFFQRMPQAATKPAGKQRPKQNRVKQAKRKE